MFTRSFAKATLVRMQILGSVAFFITLQAQAQINDFVWASQLTSAGDFAGNGIGFTVASDGSVYTTGDYTGTIDLDPNPSVAENESSLGFGDIFVSKLDGNGDFVWGFSIGGTASSWGGDIVTDVSGNVYVTGSFFGTIDCDPGGGAPVNLLAGIGNSGSLFICKYNSSGALLWARSFETTTSSSGFEDHPASIDVDSSGNVYLTGEFYGTVDFNPAGSPFELTSDGYDPFVAKLSTNGGFISAVQFEGGTVKEAKPVGIFVDASGNVHVTASFEGSMDFDPSGSTFNLQSLGSGTYDVYVCKLNTDLGFVWARQFGGLDDALGISIAVDSAGSVYTTGAFKGTFDFDPGVGTANLVGSTSLDGSAFVSKLDSSGDYVWATRVDGTSMSYGIAVDASGNVYSTGFFTGTVDFRPAGSALPHISLGGFDAFVLHQSASDGSVISAAHFGAASNVAALDINLDGSGNFDVLGLFEGTVDFDLSSGIAELSSGGYLDVFLLEVQDGGTAIDFDYIFVDFSRISNGDGSENAPFNNLSDGVAAAVSGASISIAPETSNETFAGVDAIDKALTLVNNQVGGGSVVVGQTSRKKADSGGFISIQPIRAPK